MTGVWTKQRGVVAALAVALILLAGSTPTAHDVPNEVVVQAFVKPDGEQIHLVLRLPLILLADVDLPKRGLRATSR